MCLVVCLLTNNGTCERWMIWFQNITGTTDTSYPAYSVHTYVWCQERTIHLPCAAAGVVLKRDVGDVKALCGKLKLQGRNDSVSSLWAECGAKCQDKQGKYCCACQTVQPAEFSFPQYNMYCTLCSPCIAEWRVWVRAAPYTQPYHLPSLTTILTKKKDSKNLHIMYF